MATIHLARMFHSKMILRVIAVFLVIFLPFGYFSSLVFGKVGIWIGFLLSGLSIALSLCLSEFVMIQVLGKSDRNFTGLYTSLDLVVKELGGRVPRLIVFPDPIPEAFGLRSFFGRGTLLMSQGLVGLLDEKELRTVMKICVIRMRHPFVIFQGLCSVGLVLSTRLAPRSWVDLVFLKKPLASIQSHRLNSLSALRFVLAFPVIRFFLIMGKAPSKASQEGELCVGQISAMRKMNEATRIFGGGSNEIAFRFFSLKNSFKA